MTRTSVIFTSAATLLFLAPASMAAAGKNAFYISANKVVLSKKRNVSEYHGNVRIRHGDMKLAAQRARSEGKDGNKPGKIMAWGKPLMVKNRAGKGSVGINAARAVYTTASSLLELSGEVSINYDGDIFTTERIFYHPPSGRLWSDKSGRPVNAQIKLKKKQQNRNE